MRTVVIASGKGGTGKTTLAAAFAHLAVADQREVVVADCDVEAANLPIALGASGVTCVAFGGASEAVIDPSICTVCGACANVCRFGAIGPSVSGNSVVYRVDPWACEGCGACTLVCPTDAATMRPKQAGEACSGSTKIGPIVYGNLRPGEDLSGKLVTEVRERAKGLAEETDDTLLIIDGPPGIGCPVIAAITNTDHLVGVTEPTASGLHDLDRLVRLARKLDVPVSAVLNKADLSAGGAERLRAYCLSQDIPLLGEVPFDAELASLLGGMAEGRGFPQRGEGDDSPGIVAVRNIWEQAQTIIGR
ncbi:MAG: ATP-binding protein [Coriobacteriia bacterium]|nr:ATP-binding protein [Coriobacteriia bacterium]